MKRVMVWTLMLTACLLFGSLAPAQAMTADEMELTGLYNAIFVDVEPAPEEEPVDVDGDGDIDADDYAAAANVYCCTQAGSCIRTTAAKCVGSTYNGVVCASVPACRLAGCTT